VVSVAVGEKKGFRTRGGLSWRREIKELGCENNRRKRQRKLEGSNHQRDGVPPNKSQTRMDG